MHTHIAYLSAEEKARPVGVRVVEPPSDTRQAVRGNLYAVVEFAENEMAYAELVEKVLSVIQRTYYTIKGTHTFVLTEALREALNLFQVEATTVSTARNSMTTGSPPPNVQAPIPGILLLTKLGDRITAVGAGPAIALVTSGTNVDVYPPYAAGDERDPHAPIDIYRREIVEGGAFLLAGQRCLQHFTLRELASIVAYVTVDNVADVAAALRSQAAADTLAGLIAVIEPVDSGDMGGDDLPVKGAVSPLQRRRGGGLPGALSTSPPVRQMSSDEIASQSGMAVGPSVVSEQDSPRWPNDAMVHEQDWAGDDERETGTTSTWAESSNRLAGAGRFGKLFATIGSGWQHVQSGLGGVLGGGSTTQQQEREHPGDDEPLDALPEQQETVYNNTERHYTALSPETTDATFFMEDSADDLDADESVQAALSDVQTGSPGTASPRTGQQPISAGPPHFADSATAVQSPLPQTFSPPSPTRTMGRRARIFAFISLLILLLTIVIVASASWIAGRGGVIEAERLLDGAEASFLSAQGALDVDDKSTARLKLTEAQALINEATTLVGTRLERADQLNARIEQELAALLQIKPLQALAVPLVRFPPEAQPQRVIVSDQDIYVLDTGRQLIHYFELDPTRNIVPNPEGEVILAQGDVIDGATVGRLVDIAWLPPIAGVQDKSYLLVLDGSSNLFRFDRRVEGAGLLALGGREELRTPVQLQVYADRLYLADAGTNQLYRYERGDFSSPPSQWFTTQIAADLSTLRAMAIDGDIWMLYERESLKRYSVGNQVQFSLETSFGQIQDPVDLAVGNQNSSMIYVADGIGERILVFSKDGAYQRQLRAPEGDALRNLRGIAVDEVAGIMYILTQSSLFNHPLPR